MRKTFASYLLEKAVVDEKIILVTGDLGYGVLDEFAETLPNQYLNLGVTEQSSISFCAGLAAKGFRPFFYSIANFPTFRCLEQIRNDICYMRLPVTIVAVGAGFTYNSLGYSHHAVEDIAVMRSLENISIYSPSSNRTVMSSIDKILSKLEPSYLRLGLSTDVAIEDNLISETHTEINSEIVICFTGSMASFASNLASLLFDSPFSVSIREVFELTYDSILKNLQDFREVSLIVTLEEHSVNGGLGTFFLETLNKESLEIQVLRVGIEKTQSDKYYPREDLLELSGINIDEAAKEIVKFLTALEASKLERDFNDT